MRTPSDFFRPAALIALLCLLLPSAMVSAADDMQALRACAGISSDAERLACYDREVRQLPAGSTSGTAVAAASVAAAAPAPVKASPQELFGLPDSKVSEIYVASEDAEKVKEVTGKVATVRPLDAQRSVIELDNGQQWRQVDTDGKVRFKPGDEVTIKLNAFGSYWMSGNGRYLRVKRIR